MHLNKSKKILLYLFLLIILSTFHNQILNKIKYPNLKNVIVSGLNENQNKEIINKLIFLKFQNLFILDSTQIKEILDTNTSIQNYTVFKKFPSSLIIEIEQAKILANLYKDGSNYFVGSNGKLIKANFKRIDKPFLLGNFTNDYFLKLKEIIDKSKLEYKDIKKIYFFDSGRCDIELLDGLLIRLPEKNLLESLNLSVKLMSSDKFKDIRLIDARVKNQVIFNDQ